MKEILVDTFMVTILFPLADNWYVAKDSRDKLRKEINSRMLCNQFLYTFTYERYSNKIIDITAMARRLTPGLFD
jgi:transcriptional regulator of met regulon